jgi:hypothetical protein
MGSSIDEQERAPAVGLVPGTDVPALFTDEGYELGRTRVTIGEPTVTRLADAGERRLNEEEMAHLVEALAHGRPPPVVVAALRRRTGGDALLLTQLAQELLAGGVLGPGKPWAAVLEWIEAASLPEASAPVEQVFRREGDYWTITYTGLTVRLRDVKGLSYLAHLLLHPGRLVHVTELIAHSQWREDRTATERARLAVTKAIKGALARIAACHPALGVHLAATIRRGYRCRYLPDPDRSVRWIG